MIGSGRVVARTSASNNAALGSGLDQLNSLLATARTVLAAARPLLASATPVLGHAASTAAGLLPAPSVLRPAVRYARATGLRLEPAARAAVPAFIDAIAGERWLRPLAIGLTPLTANLVPSMGHVASQLRGWEAFIANTADALNHGHSVGPWLQGFLEVSGSGLTGGYAPCSSSLGLCVNPYPKPGESANPQPYEKGRYPKLLPYFPR